jgi:hypothetical protein
MVKKKRYFENGFPCISIFTRLEVSVFSLVCGEIKPVKYGNNFAVKMFSIITRSYGSGDPAVTNADWEI